MKHLGKGRYGFHLCLSIKRKLYFTNDIINLQKFVENDKFSSSDQRWK
jgi:hypothetical protein